MKNKAESLTLPDFKTYYKTMAIKMVWFWNKNIYIERSMEQNRDQKSLHM